MIQFLGGVLAGWVLRVALERTERRPPPRPVVIRARLESDGETPPHIHLISKEIH